MIFVFFGIEYEAMRPEFTSNHLMDRLVPGTIIPKILPNSDSLALIANRLPITGKFTGVKGMGDFDHSRSSEGSFTLGYDSGVVAKVPVGVVEVDAVIRSLNVQKSIRHFSEVSPKTMVVVADTGEGIPKSVVFQSEVVGTPICDIPVSKLFDLNILKSLKVIIELMDSWYKENHSYDLCGQKPSQTRTGLVATFIPFLSDNIMVGDDSRVWLTDNILEERPNPFFRKTNFAKFLKRKILHFIPLIFIDSLIFAKNVADIFSSDKTAKQVGQPVEFTL